MENKKTARVRFAPSPTGFLHIGSARTALFNWLYAKNQKGVFIIRIEDTDASRSKNEYLEEIQSSLKWLGMEADEGPYHQSQRFDLYAKYLKTLIDNDKAYYEHTERGKAARLKNTTGKIVFYDMLKGKIEFDSKQFDDLVLFKSDGTPTYNFACVVDDIEMNISHIIRGDDHISNTPKQVMIYEAIGIKPPKFIHIPLILGEDKTRMSKRHGATSIAEYRQKGYLPQAIVNFLALMGWSPKDNGEQLSVNEIIKLFSLKNIKNASAVFDIKKLDWLNAQHIKTMSKEELADFLEPFLKAKGLIKTDFDKNKLIAITSLYSTRINNAEDFVKKSMFFFTEQISYDQTAVEEHINKKNLSYIDMYVQTLEQLKSFTAKDLETATKNFAELKKINWSEIIHPVRVAVTGSDASAGIFEILEIIGREDALKRLRSIKTQFKEK